MIAVIVEVMTEQLSNDTLIDINAMYRASIAFIMIARQSVRSGENRAIVIKHMKEAAFIGIDYKDKLELMDEKTEYRVHNIEGNIK